MLEISIMIEGQMGLTWPRWKRIVEEVEALGFAGLFRSDHYTNPQGPDEESLEMVVSMVYVAAHTRRIHFGPLVAPVSFREPTMLARQAAAIDDLSGGRFIFGLGAGWQEREHHNYGHHLGGKKERMDRFEDALEVITRLLRADEPSTYEGEYFQIRDAVLLPRPERPGGPPIMVGGSGRRRTLPLVARFADWWNGVGAPPDEFREISTYLDGLLAEQGRRPEAVKRTVMNAVLFARTREELEARLSKPPFDSSRFEGKSPDEKIAMLRDGGHWLVGNGEEIAGQMNARAAAGVQEIMTQWFELDDIEGLRAYAEDVLPRLRG